MIRSTAVSRSRKMCMRSVIAAHLHQNELRCHLQGARELEQEVGREALVVTPPKCQMPQTLQPRDRRERPIQMLFEVGETEAWYASIVLQRLQRSWQATAQLAADTLETC
jgi:hypothetical protein